MTYMALGILVVIKLDHLLVWWISSALVRLVPCYTVNK